MMSELISTFLGRVFCYYKTHTRKTYTRCVKGCGSICNHSIKRSRYIAYIYLSGTGTYCLKHFPTHSIIHVWDSNTVKIFNPDNSIFRLLSLNAFKADSNAESISNHQFIFIIGG